MRTIALAIALVVGLILPAFAQKAEIEAVNAKWIDLFNKGDFAGVASRYTDDATAFPPGSGMVKGRAAIEALWKNMAKKSAANISWCGRRSEATGSSRPISGTTASRSRIRNVRVCAPMRGSNDEAARVHHPGGKAQNFERTVMNRRHFLTATAIGAGAGVSSIAMPAIAQSMPQIRWRLATSWPKSLDTLYGSCEVFAKRVAEITDNRFQLQLFAAGEIVPGLAVLDAVQNQTVEVGNTAAYYYVGKDAALAFGTAVPFGLNARQMESWLVHGGGNDLLQEVFASFNCYGIPMGNTGSQMGGWFRKEINKVEDLQGLKFRIGGFAGQIISRLGVVPQQLAPGDIYSALEKGTIDAVEWIGPADDEKLGFHKIAKYYYYPAWWEGGANAHTLVNADKWRELPKSYQAVLLAAARDAGNWMTGKYDAANPPAIKRLVAGGVLLRPFSQEIMEACYKAANQVYAETGATNPRFKKIYESLAAFRSESYLWWQVDEMGFDSFQVRMRSRT